MMQTSGSTVISNTFLQTWNTSVPCVGVGVHVFTGELVAVTVAVTVCELVITVVLVLV